MQRLYLEGIDEIACRPWHRSAGMALDAGRRAGMAEVWPDFHLFASPPGKLKKYITVVLMKILDQEFWNNLIVNDGDLPT